MIRIIALILLAVSAAGADTNWEALRALKTGERVVIVDSKMRKHQGKLTHWDENAIQVDTETGPVSVERANVARVSTAERSHRMRNMLIGAGVGVAAGIALDATVGERFRNEGSLESARALFYVAPAAAGVALGAIPSPVTVYRAPKK